jgi:hypothetical protein
MIRIVIGVIVGGYPSFHLPKVQAVGWRLVSSDKMNKGWSPEKTQQSLVSRPCKSMLLFSAGSEINQSIKYIF